jgi:hypothetical protein
MSLGATAKSDVKEEGVICIWFMFSLLSLRGNERGRYA